jgi:hypothetical protein
VTRDPLRTLRQRISFYEARVEQAVRIGWPRLEEQFYKEVDVLRLEEKKAMQGKPFDPLIGRKPI